MFWKQLYLLLWKNFILRKRHPVRTIIEILWPIFLFAILVAIRKTQPIDTKGECHYPGRAMPSAGVYPWFKSLLCDLENPCFSKMVPSEVPGQINSPENGNGNGLLNSLGGIFQLIQQNTSVLSNPGQLNSDLQALLNLTQSVNTSRVAFSTVLTNATTYADFLTTNLSLPTATVDALLNSTVALLQVSTLQATLQQRIVVCNPQTFQLTFQFPPTFNTTTVTNQLCNLTDAQLALLSSYTGSSLVTIQPLGLLLNQNSTNLNEVLKRVTGYSSQLQTISGPAASLLSSSQSASGGLGLFTGNFSFNDFCGHPHTKTTQASSLLTGGNQNLTSGLLQILTTSQSSGPINSTAFCQNLTSVLESNNQFKFLWQVLKPLLVGKIPYTPDTPLVRSIIKRANATFETIGIVQEFGQLWLSTNGPALYNLLESGATVQSLRTILNTTPLNTLATLFNTSVSNVEQLKTFLSNDYSPTDGITTWKDLYYQLNSGILLITNVLRCVDLNKFEGYPSEWQLVDDALLRTKNKTLWGGIVFPDLTATSKTLPKVLKYKIRQDASSVTRTTSVQRFFWRPGAESGTGRVKYYVSGFVHIQDMLEDAIVEEFHNQHNNVTTSNTNSQNILGKYLQLMPYPCFTRDRFLEYLSGLLSLLMTLAWIYSVCIIIKNIVYEKEQRLKEVMKMMGLSNGVHWVAWFINSFILMFVSILLLLMVLKVGDVTPYSNMFIVMLWLCCFAIATISQCFLISCFFSRANLAAACGGIIYFVLYIPYNMAYAWEDRMTLSTKLVACLLSTVSFGYGAGYISQYEMSGDGIQFYNWNKSPDPSDGMNFLLSMLMMLVDAAIYLILTWYIEAVFPGQYGVPRPWNFFLHRSYWCGNTKPRDTRDSHLAFRQQSDEELKLENEPTHLKLGVSIKNLKKVYSNGKVAVDDLSLNFYESQITAFLGHNGAGKTTTMSMLTGLFPPSGGTAQIYGSDIRTDMDSIRHELGFCPQHNVLFGDLTVLEHLQLYAGLKGASSGKVQSEEETDSMLRDVGLPHKKNEVSRHLSGGMKRKLSVAVAFVGGSKCVVLDEPTAGVDPYARRGIWDLLLHYKQNRTILLSTHHMDEADLLGDRIAIISHGKLKCCGSSLFLKSCFGVGYYLTLIKEDKEASDASPIPEKLPLPKLDEGFESSFSSKQSLTVSEAPSSSTAVSSASTPSTLHDVSFIEPKSTHYEHMVMEMVSGAKLYEENGREITFVLPYAAQADGSYVKLFEKLDDAKVNYGLTDTSLEEIFLNVAEQNIDEGRDENKKCCSCFPKRRKASITPASTPEFEMRRGVRARLTSRSISSEFSGMSTSPLVHDDQPSEVLDDSSQLELDDGSQGKGAYKVEGNKLVRQQFFALFVKRFHHARTSPLPFIHDNDNLDTPIIQNNYNFNTPSFHTSNDNTSNSISNSASDAFVSDPSIGMRCVKDYSVYNYNKKYITCNAQSNQEWEMDASLKALSQNSASNNTLVCSCTDKQTRVLLAECPSGTGGSPTPRIVTQTSNPMYNMTQRNISDWLVKTVEGFKQDRFGGLSFGAKYHSTLGSTLSPLLQFALSNSNFTLNINPNTSNTVQSIMQRLERTENSKVWFDNNGWHSMPTWLNIMNNAALRSLLPPTEDPREYGIAAFNHPLNFTEAEVDLAAFTQSATDTIISISVIFALAFVPASFVLFLIEEKVSKAKHLQFVSGVNQFIYWIANFSWDMLNYSVPAVIVIIIFLCFQTDAYVSASNLPCLVCLLFLYGFSITPMMYPASFYFEVPSTAYVVLTCINLFIGINTSIATFILELLDDPNLTAVNDVLKIIFLAFPQYCLGRALIDMAINQAYADAYAAFGINSFKNPFDFDLVGRNLLAMAIEGVVFFILTVLIQYRFFIKRDKVEDLSKIPHNSSEEDDDVAAEKQRLLKSDVTDILRIKNLTKVYTKVGSKKRLLAVDRMCVGVPQGECFGLLGVNGAGKTTTFKMLTGDIAPTAGDAWICDRSIMDNIREVQQNTGYCPQFEALNQLLTGREHLEFYAKLRGVPPEDISRVAEWGIKRFGLTMYADKTAGTYSGGNKRKLSAAIAFIGCPPIVFLDEPTAGMDPLSRRFLWGRISEAVSGGRCIVLTSHSMEECEALCTRLAIMVNGSFKCIGGPQHLKNRYGEGYTITIKVAGNIGNLELVKSFVEESFPSSIVKESHSSMIMYQIPLEDTKLSFLFDALERNKSRLNIEDYSVSQTTLDEVFVSFAKLQTDGLEHEYGLQRPILASEGGAENDDMVLHELTTNYSHYNPTYVA
nr:ATP-binding cassette sub-family A member 1-like [Ciona intestinalis]|eukprot:XP_026691296.1 ATP-binding cassette sub-family A member 1-like [Ciona intestinalis]